MKSFPVVRRGVWVFIATSLFICTGGFAQDAPTLENALVRISFAPENGAFAHFTDKGQSHDHIAIPDATGLWTAALPDGRIIASSAAKSFKWDASTPQSLSLTWTDFSFAEAPDLRVTASISLTAGKPESRWHIRFENLGTLAPSAIHFPRITGIAPQENETLAVPIWMGERTRQARDFLNRDGNGGRNEWEYPGILSMQCLAFYGGHGAGLRLSTNDTNAQRKLFAVFGGGKGGVGLEVVHLPAQSGSKDSYEPPCEVLLGSFHGDWYTVAEEYRAWAKDQAWVRDSRMKQGQTPAWVRDTGLWVWNRGSSPGVLGPAAALQDAAGLPVSVFWHWWHGCAYDAGFPEYLPPREGAEAFRSAMSGASANGLHAIVYMNQRLWGMTTKSWIDEGAERFAVKQPDGSVAPENYNTFMKAPCASMCMGTEFWRNKYSGLAQSAVRDLGVDGIYMDQACSSCACYDPAHGHPVGGGSYWMEGFRLLQADIRRGTADVKPVALAGEGCGEAWLPYLDMMLSLQVSMERYAAPGVWEPIPFFHAVYHDCATFYGNYSSLTRPPYDDLWPAETAPKVPLVLLDRKFSTQFRLEQARAFVWGQQPTVANFQHSHLVDRKEEMEYVLQLARLRKHAAKFLRDGIFLRPPIIAAPEVEIPMSRLSIYAGQQGAVKEFTKTQPLALASAWQAPDSTIGVVVVNIGNTPLNLPIHLTQSGYPIPAQGTIQKLAVEYASPIGSFSNGCVEFSSDLAPCTAAVYVVRAN